MMKNEFKKLEKNIFLFFHIVGTIEMYAFSSTME